MLNFQLAEQLVKGLAAHAKRVGIPGGLATVRYVLSTCGISSDHGGLFSATDVCVQQGYKLPAGALFSAEAMQPVHHRKLTSPPARRLVKAQ